MKWDKLKHFYQVVKAGSFVQAGENIHLSQSSLSRSVQDLEYSLKTKLFERKGRGVILTTQGEILFNATKKMFETLNKATTTINEEASEPQGPLKLATTVSFANFMLVHHLPDFVKRFPKIKLSICGTDDILDLAIREADVALRTKITSQSGLIHRYIMTSYMQLFASKEYLAEFGTPKKPEELDKHRLVGVSTNIVHPFSNINWHLSLGCPTGEIRESYLDVSSGYSMRRAGEVGLGIVTLSKDHPIPKDSNLVRVLPDIKGQDVDNYYIYPEHLKNSMRVQVLGDYLEAIWNSTNQTKKAS